MIIKKTKKITNKAISGRLTPVVIKWKNIPMVRNHSFLATIHEIIAFSSEIDVCRIGLLGDMHSGKSTLSQAIAHAIHKKAKVPYSIKVLYKYDLLNFKQTLKDLKPINYILIFDDVSFLGADANKKQIEMVKQAITTIRHISNGKDVKIIAMMNYHYSLGLDKYLRQADFKYVLTIGSSENENYEKAFGSRYNKKIINFKKYRHQAVTKKYWMMRIGPKDLFKYTYRDPFIPVLFWNEESLRLIVSPTRQWMDDICSVCTEAEHGITESEIPIEKFVEECNEKFGEGNFKSAIKLNLYVNGLTVYGANVVNALRYLGRCQEKKIISLEQLATHYGFEITKTKLRKKMDGVMSN